MNTLRPGLSAIQEERILRLFDQYRVVLGAVLVMLVSSELGQELFQLTHPQLFSLCSWVYLGLNILLGLVAPRPTRSSQIFSLALVDLILLSILFYSAGGAASGIGNLFIVSVALSNILLRGRIGILVAAVASIGLIYQTFYLSLSHSAAGMHYVQVGALGALCFGAALFVQGVTARLQVSETLAAQRAADVADLEQLNSLILQRMRTGILVIDNQHRVILANDSAHTLLHNDFLTGMNISQLSPALAEQLAHWHANPTLRPTGIHSGAEDLVLQPSFVSLKHGEHDKTLIFLDDASILTQQAQQLKLASLGRLTAGIAHEIRNPLGAISHAAQLLQESEELAAPDKRLAQIIHEHTQRMNLVIENVLQLSRRRPRDAQLLDLKYWIHRFCAEFRVRAKPDQQLHIHMQTGSIQTRMDPHQLTQVLSNLIDNGLRHSAQRNASAQVWLDLYKDAQTQLPILEISDDGPGIAEEQMQDLFEPFFTTESHGTGLGLYLSKEMCESNQAHLSYQPSEHGGSCFIITFAHPHQ